MATLANQGMASQAAFGQHGSAFLDAAADYTPPSGKVVVAITLIADTVFDKLEQEASTATNDLTIGFFGTLGEDNTYSGGGMGNMTAANPFPKGLTIYGRWATIRIQNGGACILYFGPAKSPIQTA